MLRTNEIDTPKRVLVVDDEDDIRGIVSEVLADEGYEVATAPHGAAALDLAGAECPGVILLDMRMPVMNGWQFAQAYRRMPGPHAPIVVMTAASDASAWCAEIGANACLPKPFDLDDLLRVVGEHAHPN